MPRNTDPKRSDAIVRYSPAKPSEEEGSPDYWSLMSMAFGMSALLLKVRESGC